MIQTRTARLASFVLAFGALIGCDDDGTTTDMGPAQDMGVMADMGGTTGDMGPVDLGPPDLGPMDMGPPPGATRDDALPLQVGTGASVETDAAGRFYALDVIQVASAGHRVTLSFATNGTASVNFTWMNADGVVLREASAAANSDTVSDVWYLGGAPDPGLRYYVHIATDMGETLTGTLTAAYDNSPVADCATIPGAIDPDDDYMNATAISVGYDEVLTLCENTLGSRGAYFSFNLPSRAGVRWSVQAVNEVPDADMNSFGIGLASYRASDGEERYSKGSSVNNGADAYELPQTLDAGDHLVSINMHDEGLLQVRVRLIADTPCADDAQDMAPNDDDFVDSAPMVSTGAQAGTLCTDDRDRRRFSVTSGETITVDVSTTGRLYSRILHPNGAYCGAVGNWVSPASCTATMSGTYSYVLFAGDGSAYTATLTIDVP